MPAGVTAVGIPAKIVMPKDKSKTGEFRAYATTPEGVPDPVQQVLDQMRQSLGELKDRVDELEQERDDLRTKLGGKDDDEDDGKSNRKTSVA